MRKTPSSICVSRLSEKSHGCASKAFNVGAAYFLKSGNYSGVSWNVYGLIMSDISPQSNFNTALDCFVIEAPCWSALWAFAEPAIATVADFVAKLFPRNSTPRDIAFG